MPIDKKTFDKDATREIERAIRDIDRHLARCAGEPRPLDGSQHDKRCCRVLVASLGTEELLFPFFRSRLSIGRAANNDIILGASSVSRHHALIQNDRHVVRIVDWGSTNGVYVNGSAVTGHPLRHGDSISIGSVCLRYEER